MKITFNIEDEEKKYTDLIISAIFRSKGLYNIPDPIALSDLLSNTDNLHNDRLWENTGIKAYFSDEDKTQNNSIEAFNRAIKEIEFVYLKKLNDTTSFFESISEDSKHIRDYTIDLSSYFSTSPLQKTYNEISFNNATISGYVERRIEKKSIELLYKENIGIIRSNVNSKINSKKFRKVDKNHVVETNFTDSIRGCFRVLIKEPNDSGYYTWLRGLSGDVNKYFRFLSNNILLTEISREIVKNDVFDPIASEGMAGIQTTVDLATDLYSRLQDFVEFIDDFEIKTYVTLHIENPEMSIEEMTIEEMAPSLGKKGQGISHGTARNKSTELAERARQYLTRFVKLKLI